MLTVSLHLTTKHDAEFVTAQSGAWISVENDTGNDVSLFLPRGVPADKVMAICDAINDALDSVRAPVSLAAE